MTTIAEPVEDPRMERARTFIEENACTRRCTLPRVAQVAGLSMFHFLRTFKARYGVTPKAHATNVQIEKARQLLAGGHRLGDVAVATGFRHASHLCERFRQVVGVTPGHWQKSQRKGR